LKKRRNALQERCSATQRDFSIEVRPVKRDNMLGRSDLIRHKMSVKARVLFWLNQLFTAPELRVPKPRARKQARVRSPQAPVSLAPNPPEARAEHKTSSSLPIELAAEVANCLWYVKTKHFQCSWNDQELQGDDARMRRTLVRINTCTQALAEAGLELVDPIGKPFPKGAEGLMKARFTPTAGIVDEFVSETMRPIVYFRRQIVQRGEVFVAVPIFS
jgi:hypothetical protein